DRQLDVRVWPRSGPAALSDVGRERLLKSLCECLLLPSLALPDHMHVPSYPLQVAQHLSVPGYVLLELAQPESESRLGRVRESATRMPVPEASVNQKNRPVTRQNHIRLTR